ncbi:MAG TPA: DUF4232 domain-containing protein [Candidatus Dormibacteraeota bacterium]
MVYFAPGHPAGLRRESDDANGIDNAGPAPVADHHRHPPNSPGPHRNGNARAVARTDWTHLQRTGSNDAVRTFGAGAGSAAEILVLTDAGSHRCKLDGTPEVRFLDRQGRVVPLAVLDQTGGQGFFPAIANAGVGLVALTKAGTTGTAGIRGQAGVEIEWPDGMCATSAPITRVAVVLPTGTLSVPLQIEGFGTTGCQRPGATVSEFEAAEIAG